MQTLCVIYYTDMIYGSFSNIAENKIRHFMIDTLTCILRDHCVTNQQKKSDTMC